MGEALGPETAQESLGTDNALTGLAARLGPSPSFLMLNVTERCNSRCTYCPVWQSGGRVTPVTPSEYESLFRDAKALGAWQVVLSGGEPLLNQDLEQVIQLASAPGFLVVVVTNGINLTEHRANSLASAGLRVITLSLDTLDPEVYFKLRGVPIEGALRALCLLEEMVAGKALRATLNCVFSAQNHTQIPEVVARATAHEMSVQIQVCHTFGQPELNHLAAMPENLSDIQDSVDRLVEMKNDGYHIGSSIAYLRHIPTFLFERRLPVGYECAYGELAITVDSQLDLLPCWYLPPIGNLRRAPLTSLWNSDTFVMMREAMRQGQCPGCWLVCNADWEISCPDELIRE